LSVLSATHDWSERGFMSLQAPYIFPANFLSYRNASP
jgi:hypothetical protein